jgi:hypothetical protein
MACVFSILETRDSFFASPDFFVRKYTKVPTQPMAKNDGMVAFREEKIALIPGQAGSYTLPPIEIPWWNTQTQKMEVARIAARTLTAIAATSSLFL